MENIEELLDNEIVKTIKDVTNVKAGSEEAKALLIKLDKLHAQRIKELEQAAKSRQMTDSYYLKMEENNLKLKELEQRAKQFEAESESRQAELDQKEAELKEAKKVRRWKTVLDMLGIGVPVAASAYWLHRGMQFEEEGKIYTSRTMQWLSAHLRLFGKKG